MILSTSVCVKSRSATGKSLGVAGFSIEKRVTRPVASFSPYGLMSRMKSTSGRSGSSNKAVSVSPFRASTETR